MSNRNKFIFLIGDMFDFQTSDQLIRWYANMHTESADPEQRLDASFYRVSGPDQSLSDDGLSIRDIATFIGRGMAFGDGWSANESISILIESDCY